MTPDIADFFSAFERNAAALDLDAILSQYADPFMTAGPSGTQTVPLAALRVALPKRREYFKSLGLVSSRLHSVVATPLDDSYVMARTEWLWEFARPEKLDLVLPSTYILRRGNGLKIVFYLMHQDVAEVLRTR